MKTLIRIIIASAAMIISTSCNDKGVQHSSIRMNQTGFYPIQEKTLTLEHDNTAEIVTICRKDSKMSYGRNGEIIS